MTVREPPPLVIVFFLFIVTCWVIALVMNLSGCSSPSDDCPVLSYTHPIPSQCVPTVLPTQDVRDPFEGSV